MVYKKTYKYFLILFFLLLGNICLAQNTLDSLKVLFVGNSYTYYSNMPHLVSIISDSTQTKLLTAKSTAGGARLSHHWRGEKGLRTMELIKNGNFDIVVLQEQSMGAIEQPDSLLTYVQKFSNYIRKNGAKPYLYCTWSREKAPQSQETITDVYKKAARENNAGIVFVGDTWALAKKIRPNIALYVSDGSHPSSLGAFLTACAFVRELSNELPSYNYYGKSVERMHFDLNDIKFCLKVANEISE